MDVLVFLVPLALGLGGLGLAAFLWSLKTGQYDDLDGAAWRAIMDDDAIPESARLPTDQEAAGTVLTKPTEPGRKL
ncbi:MAG: cbb3-type cytochrome oxidase assembly protein CcoS [Phreatobacter sp.]|nr:cbb3-type cytochrome oxidase assembly protein CcoS [Phreatobacter sp.]MDP2800764.1 cbb3-type cytochrome oxidase assembly protein CcoS [Phreatobacter sp.]